MKKRWIILVAGILIQFVLGGIYAWSSFTPWLQASHGLSKGQSGLIFGLTIAVFTLAMIPAGRVLAARGPRLTAAIGAILFGMGYVLASFSNGYFPLLMLCLSGIAGAGIGFGYICPLATGMKWFPEKKGLVTGVSVAGFGGGAVLLSLAAEHFHQTGVPVLTFFRWYGVFTLILLLAVALFLSDPPSKAERHAFKNSDFALVRSLPFALMALGMFAGTFGGLLVIGNLVPILLDLGATSNQAAAAVSIFAIGNVVGRVSWGVIFDRFSYRSIPASLAFFAVGTLLFFFPPVARHFYILVALLGFGFGANFVLYASAISCCFGVHNFARIYPICFLFYGAAGLIAPGLGGRLADYSGSYLMPLSLCITIISIAAIIAAIGLPSLGGKRSGLFCWCRCLSSWQNKVRCT